MTRGSEYSFSLLGAASPALGTLRVSDTGILRRDRAVLHGLDEDEHLHILVPVDDDEVIEADERSAGVQLRPRVLAEGSLNHRYLDVVCMLPHLNQLFFVLADEMLAAIEAGPEEAPSECRKVLERWRELLGRKRSRVLSMDELIGLFAELLVLADLAEREPTTAIARWRGPDQHRFDFVAGDAAIESKATTAREGRFAEINGVMQLDPPRGGELYLAFTRLEQVDTGERSIPELIQHILDQGVAALEFFERLADSGYQREDERAYEPMRFRVTERLFYRVDDAFPRITPGSFRSNTIPSGVLDVRYRIDLTGSNPCPLEEGAVSRMLDSFTIPI